MSSHATDAGGIRESAKEALAERNTGSHSREDALTPRQFEQLLTATHHLEDGDVETECRTLLFLTGRLGLRKGEVAHLDASWIDWAEGVIEIPAHDECTNGKFAGEVCGYCRNRAKARAEASEITHDEAVAAIKQAADEAGGVLTETDIEAEATALQEEVRLTKDEAVAMQWQPKTRKSARRLPFDFDVRVEMELERFFERFDGWEPSACTVNRRVNCVVEESDVEAAVYPHSLRATAASYHASRDLSIHSLMAIMGWSDPSTARAYVTSNADSAAKELRSKHR